MSYPYDALNILADRWFQADAHVKAWRWQEYLKNVWGMEDTELNRLKAFRALRNGHVS